MTTEPTTPAPTPPTTVQADRDAGQVRLTEGERDRLSRLLPSFGYEWSDYAEEHLLDAVDEILNDHVDAALVEGANIGIYMRRAALAARQSDPDATERGLVEALRNEQHRRCSYGTREGDGRTCDCKYDMRPLRPPTSETTGCPELRAAIQVLVRRTVTTSAWTEVGE